MIPTPRPTALAFALALALVPSILLPSTPAPSTPAPTTFVIVHGAWGGGWDWRTVDSLLTARGHRVYRPDLTGLASRSHLASVDVDLDTHIRDIANLLLWEELDDVVLVGHSYGGMVITGVADRLPDRVRERVYVDAFLPDSGESVVQLAEPGLRQVVAENTRDGVVVAPWTSADRPIPKDTPHPVRTLTDGIVLTGGADQVPGRYILTAEPAVQPDPFRPFADRAAERGWPVVTLEAGHVPERTHPEELVALILGEVWPERAGGHGAGAHEGHMGAEPPDPGHDAPYAGLERREIASLSTEEIDGLRSGAGLGMALPAELNGFPGPRHVLELADSLQLTAEQRARTRTIHEAMLAEATTLGRRVVELEQRLDDAFAAGDLGPDRLGRLLDEIGRVTAALRGAHLRAHLEMKPVLTADQRAVYDRLRGYAPSP